MLNPKTATSSRLIERVNIDFSQVPSSYLHSLTYSALAAEKRKKHSLCKLQAGRERRKKERNEEKKKLRSRRVGERYEDDTCSNLCGGTIGKQSREQ